MHEIKTDKKTYALWHNKEQKLSNTMFLLIYTDRCVVEKFLSNSQKKKPNYKSSEMKMPIKILLIVTKYQRILYLFVFFYVHIELFFMDF